MFIISIFPENKFVNYALCNVNGAKVESERTENSKSDTQRPLQDQNTIASNLRTSLLPRPSSKSRTQSRRSLYATVV